MKKRWLLNLILLAVVASLVTFLYVRPKTEVKQSVEHEVSAYKLSEFNMINVEFPAKAAVVYEKINGYWQITSPYKTRADQASVQRILAIVAARSSERIAADDIEKFGLNAPALRLKLYRDKENFEEFLFGTHSALTDQQYVLHRNTVYLIDNIYAESASTQLIEMVDKSPLKPTEKVVGFDFGRLEQWEAARLNVDLIDGKWNVSIKEAAPDQNELNEWLDFSWLQNRAKSVELYTPDRKTVYPSLKVKMADGSKVHFDKIQEAPDLLLARPDEGIIYTFPSDAGFVMLNPPVHLPGK